MPEPGLIDQFRSMCRSGDFRGLDVAVADRPDLVFEEGLWLLRACLEQGHLRSARPVVARLQGLADRAWDHVRLDMHRTLFDFLVDQDFTGAARRSAEVLQRARRDLARPEQVAEIEGLACRLKLMAASVYQSGLDDALDRLDRAAEAVLAVDVDRAARMMVWRLSKLPDDEARRDAAAAGARRLLAAGARDRSAELWLMVAEKALEAPNETASIHRAIDLAADALDGRGDGVNAVDVAFARARVRELDGEDTLDEQEACVSRFRRLVHHQRLIVAHAVLATAYGERADTAAMQWHRDENNRLLAETGFGIRLGGDALDAIGREREAGDPVRALTLCEAELKRHRPEISKVGLLHARALCRSALGLAGEAVADMDAAASLARAHGADAFASEIDFHRATLRYALGGSAAFREADGILRRTAESDLQAGRMELAVRKQLERASLRYTWAVRIDSRRPPGDLLAEALAALETALALARRLPARTAGRMQLHALQQEGQIRVSLGERERAEEATRRAVELARSLQYRMIEAGCHLPLGLARQNDMKAAIQAGDVQTTLAAAVEADEMLAAAQALYEQADVLDMVGRVLIYRAEMAADAMLLPALARDPQLDAGFRRLHEMAVEVQDRRRRSVLEEEAVRRLAVMRRTTADYARLDATMARYLLVQRQSPDRLWAWMRRTKARSFVDWLAAAAPAVRTADGDRPPDGAPPGEAGRIDEELRSPVEIPSARRRALLDSRREAARAVRVRGGPDPAARPASATPEQAREWLAGLERPVALVDWLAVAGWMHVFVLDARHGLRWRALDILEADLMARVAAVMDPAAVGSDLRGDPGLLDDFADLVGPLADLTAPEDLLVLSPTRALWSLPLHALACGGRPLIARNPVVYAPSIPLLLQRPPRPLPMRAAAAVFGDPGRDSPESAATAERVAAMLGTTAILGAAATRQRVLDALATRRIVHFQGHAKHFPGNPLASALDLSDGPLSAEDILNAQIAEPDLVVLAGCESGIARVDAADDHEGLATALVLTGTRRVVSTLWAVDARSCAPLMTGFYRRVFEEGQGPADALRAAVIELMRQPAFRSPYHWAPYVLAGDWRC